jgi:hypothetical protein
MNNSDIKYCKNCGKQLSNELISKGKIYCNQKCYFEWRKKNPAHNNKQTFVICANCNKEFRITPAKIKGSKTGRLFCCKKCKDTYYCEGYSDINCTYCNNIIHMSNAQLKYKNNIYCNKDCKAKWESEHWTFENNPNYKGGFFKQCKYCSNEYWVYNSEKERSSYCCKECQTKDFQENISKSKEFIEQSRQNAINIRRRQKQNLQNPN